MNKETVSTRRVICLVGPTGSGKTAAALHISRSLEQAGFPASIINADSRQIYQDFPITTAQPSQEEQAQCPHLLYGWLPTDRKSSAGQWADKARAAMAELSAQGRVPLLVGGTGLYLKALLDGMADIPAPEAAVSSRLQEQCHTAGPELLHARLRGIDPTYAARIHPHDRQRIVRALEVWESTGRTFSWWHEHATASTPETDVLRLGMGLPLPELAPFLNKRIDAMLNAGAPAEARAALDAYPDLSLPGWTGIGCRELGNYLAGHCSFEEAVELWQKNTRAYAKRQWTWFRADKRIKWFRPDDATAHQRMAELALAFWQGQTSASGVKFTNQNIGLPGRYVQ